MVFMLFYFSKLELIYFNGQETLVCRLREQKLFNALVNL